MEDYKNQISDLIRFNDCSTNKIKELENQNENLRDIIKKLEQENSNVQIECKNNIEFLEDEKNSNINLQNQLDEMNFKFSNLMKFCDEIKTAKQNHYESSTEILRKLNYLYKE